MLSIGMLQYINQTFKVSHAGKQYRDIGKSLPFSHFKFVLSGRSKTYSCLL